MTSIQKYSKNSITTGGIKSTLAIIIKNKNDMAAKTEPIKAR